MKWISVKDAKPELDQIVLLCWPSGYDGSAVYNWGARVDEGEGWVWAVKCGYGGDIQPNKTPGFNDIECEDDYPVTHWMPLPSPPSIEAQALEAHGKPEVQANMSKPLP